MQIYFGSGRHEGYNLPAYLDFAVRSNRPLLNFPNDGSVHRTHLPRRLFQRSCGIKFGGGRFVRFTNFSN